MKAKTTYNYLKVQIMFEKMQHPFMIKTLNKL